MDIKVQIMVCASDKKEKEQDLCSLMGVGVQPVRDHDNKTLNSHNWISSNCGGDSKTNCLQKKEVIFQHICS